jgi:hypothetical protein
VHITVQLETGGQAPLYQIVMPPFDVKCGDQKVLHFFQTRIDPDLYDLTNAMYWVSLSGFQWQKC